MIPHEFLQDILFLLFIRGRFPHLLLPLIKHHLLHHLSRIAIKITQTRILRCDFRGVDFGGGSDDVGPPFHFVGFVEVDGEFFAGGRGFEGPG